MVVAHRHLHMGPCAARIRGPVGDADPVCCEDLVGGGFWGVGVFGGGEPGDPVQDDRGAQRELRPPPDGWSLSGCHGVLPLSGQHPKNPK